MKLSAFDTHGFCITEPLLDASACSAILASLAAIEAKGVGRRNLLDYPWCRQLAAALLDMPQLQSVLPERAAVVQCTYFEKSQEQNWLVPIHQDLSIPVLEKLDHPALSGWSHKDGAVFVQPPVEVLERLVAIRLHLEDCHIADGPLKVVPGSHKFGRLDNAAVLAARAQFGEEICPVRQAAALLLKPLLLHASSKATGNSRRRVLHFVIGPAGLPFGLQWRRAVRGSNGADLREAAMALEPSSFGYRSFTSIRR